jgi:hypothetical protein
LEQVILAFRRQQAGAKFGGMLGGLGKKKMQKGGC